MNKLVLGILIPYYKNSDECETTFKHLMTKLSQQINDKMILYVYEDGQKSNWLLEYQKDNIIIKGSTKNKGVSFARNKGIDYLINKVNYILFLDSDDMISNNFLENTYEYCADNTHEIIEPNFYIKEFKMPYEQNKVRSGCAASAIQTKIIGDIRFDEKLQIGEDTKFMKDVCDLTKYRKKLSKADYIYQFGINNNSLTKRRERKEIEKERESR